MKRTRILPHLNTCTTRRLAGGNLECLVTNPVECSYVRVGSNIFYCSLFAPLKKAGNRSLS
jgi:hypothetical protein